jgi:hypothetical protein
VVTFEFELGQLVCFNPTGEDRKDKRWPDGRVVGRSEHIDGTTSYNVATSVPGGGVGIHHVSAWTISPWPNTEEEE